MGVATLLCGTCLCQQQTPVALNPDIIAIIDGTSLGITGEFVGAIYNIIRKIQAMQLGDKNGTERIGSYTFEGERHTLKSLALRERELSRMLSLFGCKQVCAAKLDDLKAPLKKAQQDFKTIVAPFMDHARGAREPMCVLISESCIKRGVPRSLLLNWARTGDDEMASFDASVTTFERFDEFCTDLTNFLTDLVASCPKARAQFEKLKNDYVMRHKGGAGKR